MQSNHDDVTRWDETRQCFLDRNGYPANARGSIYNAATGMDGPINKILLEPTLTGTRIRSAGPATNVEVYSGTTSNGTGGGLVSNSGKTALSWGEGGNITAMGTPLAMYTNEIRLNGMGDTQFIRYNPSTTSTEIAALNGGRFLTSSGGSTIATTWDSNGFQARKYMRSSGAFSASQGSTLTVAAATRSLLPLGTMTNTGVSGSAWTSGTIGSGNVLVAPFTGTIRAHVRVCSFASNTAANYIFLRVYNPSVDATFSDGDEIITIGALSNGTQDYRGAGFAIVAVSAGERIGIAAHNGGGGGKDFQVLDYHLEYIG